MKNIKKIAALALCLAVIFALCACGSKKAESATVTPGKLTIATSPDFPPFEYLEGNEVVGIEIDILNMIAKEMGLELVIQQMDFDSVLPGVMAGKFDVGVSGITITEERKKNADFTDPYFLASQAIVVADGSPIASKADLEGKKVSVQTGTTAEEFCMANGYEVLAFQANNDACEAMLSGKVDAWVVDNEVAIDMSAKTSSPSHVLDDKMTTEPYGFAFVKDSKIVAQMNEIQAKLLKDGSIEKVFKKYNVPYVSPIA